MSAEEYKEEGTAAYGVVKKVIYVPFLLTPGVIIICIGVIDGSKYERKETYRGEREYQVRNIQYKKRSAGCVSFT